MNYKIILAIFALIVAANIASAGQYPDYYYKGGYRSAAAYVPNSFLPEPSITFNEIFNKNYGSDYSSNYVNKNFDSSNLNYDFRGPMFERQIILSETISNEEDDVDFLIFSKSENDYFKSSSAKLIEKYVGPSESLYINNQNRRTETFDVNEKVSDDIEAESNYKDALSWKQVRLFDRDEYTYGGYYYRPMYDKNRGHYVWRW